MKEKLVIGWLIVGMVLCVVCHGGPVNVKNEQAVKDRQIETEIRASPDYMSEDAYYAAVQAATKFDELKAAVLAKAKSDKMKAAKEKEKGKVSK